MKDDGGPAAEKGIRISFIFGMVTISSTFYCHCDVI